MAAVPPSITATNAGNVEHGKVVLGGPVYVLLQVIGYGVTAGAVAVVIDSLRRPAGHYGGDRARRWMWAGPQALLLVQIGAAWLTRLSVVAGAAALYLFLCAILQVAYLLVVVFPSHKEPIPSEADQEL